MLKPRLACTVCGSELALRSPHTRCPRCQSALEIRGDVWPARIDRAAAGPLARFAAFLPFTACDTSLSLGEGATPLIPVRLSRLLRGCHLELKLEIANPSGSMDDRGALACVMRARALGFHRVLVVHPGLAGCIERYAARAGLSCTVLLPAEAHAGALEQAVSFGARVIRVDASETEVLAAARECSPSVGAYLIESSDPFWTEGLKTVGLEIMETCGRQPPDAVVLPPAYEIQHKAMRKGLLDWRAAGLSDVVPAVITAKLCDDPSKGELERGWDGQSVHRREVAACRRVLCEEEGLALDEVAATVCAAALKLARARGGLCTQRVVAIVDGRPGDVTRTDPGDSTEVCRLSDVAEVLAAYRPPRFVADE